MQKSMGIKSNQINWWKKPENNRKMFQIVFGSWKKIWEFRKFSEFRKFFASFKNFWSIKNLENRRIFFEIFGRKFQIFGKFGNFWNFCRKFDGIEKNLVVFSKFTSSEFEKFWNFVWIFGKFCKFFGIFGKFAKFWNFQNFFRFFFALRKIAKFSFDFKFRKFRRNFPTSGWTSGNLFSFDFAPNFDFGPRNFSKIFCKIFAKMQKKFDRIEFEKFFFGLRLDLFLWKFRIVGKIFHIQANFLRGIGKILRNASEPQVPRRWDTVKIQKWAKF